MTIFIAPKKTAAAKHNADEHAGDANAEGQAVKVKAAPAVKVKKEYTGPKVEGEDF